MFASVIFPIIDGAIASNFCHVRAGRSLTGRRLHDPHVSARRRISGFSVDGAARAVVHTELVLGSFGGLTVLVHIRPEAKEVAVAGVATCVVEGRQGLMWWLKATAVAV